MKATAKKTLILVIAFVAIIALMVACAVMEKGKITSNQGMTVTSLSDLYDDDTRVKEDIAAMQDAGILDANGKMVDLDLRENGARVDLAALTTRIANGETVGNITVNGKDATPEQVMKISQVSAALEIAELLDTEIDVTDAHVTNLEALLTGIQNGTIDVQSTLKTGALTLSPASNVQSPKTVGNVVVRGTTSEELPENTGSGEVDATNGSYTAPYISGSNYEANHSFTLLDSDNTTWYTDSIVADGVVTITCEDSASVNKAFTVTATLDKTPAISVSFDWTAVSDIIAFTGDTSGTVTWAANDTNLDKTFQITLGAKSKYWVGSQCFIINCGNIHNAAFDGGKVVYSKTVQVTADDQTPVSLEYPNITTELTSFERGTAMYSEGYYSVNRSMHYVKTKDAFPSSGRFTVSISGSSPDYVYLVDPNVDVASNLWSIMAGGQTQTTFNPGWRGYTDKDGVFWYAFDQTWFTDGKTSGQDSLAGTVKNGEVWLVIRNQAGYDSVNKALVSIPQIGTRVEVQSVSVPAGTYYTGQLIPVTVTFKTPTIATAGTTLTVNGVDCPMLNEADTESRYFTFGYTVKDTDSGALNVTAISNTLKNKDNNDVSLEYGFPTTQIGADQGISLSSDVKVNSLDWENVQYGIDEANPGEQTVTVVIPFKSDANKTWVTNETIEINPALSIQLPSFADGAVGYLKSAYFSADNGATRYPVYVIGENADALATRFAPAINTASFLRKDTLSLYLDSNVGTDTNYLGDWADKQVDAKGFAYFGANDNTANAALGMRVSYYANASVLFFTTKTTARPNYDEANIMKNASEEANGFYKEGSEYVVVQGEDYDNLHDVELVANEVLYNAAIKGARAEDADTLILRYQISGRRNDFTFADPKYFTWTSGNEQIATVVKNEQTGDCQIVLNGEKGNVTITLTVGNGAERNKYDLTFTFPVLAGMTPFLNVPVSLRERITLADSDTDVMFSSNVTARNAEVGGASTIFTAKLYSVGAVNDTPTGDPTWTEKYMSTTNAPVTRFTVPGEQLSDTGIYAVVISATYKGGVENGVTVPAEDFAATAYLIVKDPPLKVKFKQLESYSFDYNDLSGAQFDYIITPATANAVVQYTIQKSGEAVGSRTSASGGTISFNATKPTGLKEAYTLTVYARSADAAETDPWSMDSMVLRVYNMDVLELIVKDIVRGEIGGTTGGTGDSANDTTVEMDNHDKLEDYGITGDSYQLTIGDLNALRTDMSLQKVISANYGSGVWGLLSDKMEWSSSDSDLVSINYEQGGFYADIHNYSYTSYGPATDFLLVGKDDTDGVTITATHAGTGAKATVTIAANTLKDQLYVFQFYPKVVTDVVYTNGAGVQRELKSNDKGELAVYEPQGIASSVMLMSKKDDVTYVGTIFRSELQSGEHDIAALQLYPCNNLRLRSISGATLTFLNPDGSVFNGTVKIRAGVYKNGIYCPAAESFLPASPDVKFSAQDDIVFTVSNGKVTLGFDPTSFKNDPDNAEETGAYAADKITYVFEYRVEGYQTSYAMLNVYTDAEGEQQPMDSVITLKTINGSSALPQIVRQTIRQYSGDEPVAYTRDVIAYTENIGISKKYDKVVLTTDFILPESCVTVDAQGHTTIKGDFALFTADGRKLTGQTDYSNGADPIINLADLEGCELVIFPFSTSPIGHHVYTITDANLTADGITDEGESPNPTTRIRAMFVREGVTITSISLPFGVSNLSHQKDLSQTGGGAKEIGLEVKDNLAENADIGAIFQSINVNDMIRKGFVFLGDLSGAGADSPINLMILPTADPSLFRIIAFIGANQRGGDDEDGVSVNFNSQDLAEDMGKFMEEMNKDDDDDDDDEGSGEGSMSFNFYGTIILEARIGVADGDWDISFRGGNVGANVKGKYEWGQTFFCGPYPAFISFEVGFHADLEVAFGNKGAARAMLLDAALGVSVEAFAGLGFDLSIVAIQLGIYGQIGADVNFLMLTPSDGPVSTGTKLTISGEIGIKLKVKLLFISYTEKFASTGFNWTKKWGQYDMIKNYWNDQGYGQLFGTTNSGRSYQMLLFADGSAMVAIDGGPEMESRDYLELEERVWKSGATRGLRKAAGPITDLQSNAYPYSHPIFTDDGEMFLYVSDNDNANAVESVTSYAVKNGEGYENMGRVDTAEDNVLADLDVVASGTKDNAFAAWVKQIGMPKTEKNDTVSNNDLGMMFNATEIYAGTYDGTVWTTTRLTDNSIADMAPTVASYGNNAIIAWRSMNASSMPEGGNVSGGTYIDEDFGASNMPAGWTKQGNWYISDQSLCNGGDDGGFAILPGVDLRKASNPRLTFKYKNNNWLSNKSLLKIQYSEDGTTWNDISGATDMFSQNWTEVSVELPAKNMLIRFYVYKADGAYNPYRVYFDDVRVTADPVPGDQNDAQDITAMFDVENNINYSIYNGSVWTTAKIAYNGASGSVNAIDSAMLADGTAIITYTVRTGEDVTTTETFYTVIGVEGTILTTGRLTNDDYTDTNAQATAVNEDGGYFVIGWYSEHDAGKGNNSDGQAVVAHDIRLARINANGSYDVDFPESLGITSAVTSDFRFSAPVHNTDLTNVSIVWSQRMDSDEAEDAGKYEVNAVRFFRTDSYNGFTAPTNICTTNKNYTIDHFDVYTDDEGAIHAIFLGTDYDSIRGIEVYDSIDLDAAASNTVSSNSDAPSNLDILDGEAISSLKLAKGTFPELAADVKANINIKEVIPGFTTPVQFTVTNKGTDTLTSVTATVGTESKDFTVNLLPNQTATLIMSYNVPEGAVSDVDYSVTSDYMELGSGTLILNRPDVGISGMKIIREENGERDIQVTLSNSSSIPLAGSGKTVKLALYKDPFFESMIGTEFAISGDALADIDAGTYTTVRTINVSDLSTDYEIPASGLTVYARAWVEDTKEPNIYNNDSFVTFSGLLVRNNGEKLSIDTLLEVGDGSYTVYADIRNNSLLEVNAGVPAVVLLDSDGNIVASKYIQDTELVMTKESRRSDLSVSFTADEIEGTPVEASVRFLYKVSFDVNGGSGEFADAITDLYGHIVIPDGEPTAPVNNPPVFFRGWYTSRTSGELVTEETFFGNRSTVYARYTPHAHVFEYVVSNSGDTVTATCVSTVNDDCTLEEQGRTATLKMIVPERTATGYGMPEVKLIGDHVSLGSPVVYYYAANEDLTAKVGDALTQVPLMAGKYWAELTVGEGANAATIHVAYEIPVIEGLNSTDVTIPNFVRATDPSVMTSDIEQVDSVAALAWIYANENSLNSNITKYIVCGKQYMVRPDEVPEEYWPYEDGVEYALCYVYSPYNDCEMNAISVGEIIEQVLRGDAELYVPGTGSTQVPAEADFNTVGTREELNGFNPSSKLDALLWILAHRAEISSGIFMLSQRDEYSYTFINFSYGNVMIMNGDLNYIFDMHEYEGLPIYVVASTGAEVLNPNIIYTVAFNTNGGSGSVSGGGKYYVKSKIEIPSDDGISKPNLVFNGWNTKADGTGIAYNAGDVVEVMDNVTFYAQWKHVHNWTLTYNEDTHVHTATCSVPGCPNSTLTLQPKAVDKMYDGKNAKPYVCSAQWTAENDLPIPVVTYYVDGEEVTDARNVGTYTAIVSLNGHDDEVSEFSITKRPIIVIADDQEKHENQEDPELTVSYEPVGAGLHFDNDATYPWQVVTEGDRVYAKSGNAGKGDTTSTLTLTVTLTEAGTLSFDYKYGTENNWDWCYFRVDGSEKFKQSNVRDWTNYSIDLSAGTHTLTWAYSKDGGTDKNGDFYAVDNVVIKNGGDVTTAEQENPNVALIEALNVYEGGIVEGENLNYTISREEGEAMGDYAITVEMGDNPNYDVREVRNNATFTILESLGERQTIEADDVTATYGDTGLKIDAVITEGDGTLSYAVKSGDAVTVDEEGNLTIVKAGTAVITVTASQTEVYAPATKNVTVTIEKAMPSYTVPTNLTATYGQTLANVTLTGGFAWTNNTLSVGDVGNNTFKATFTPADTTNYKVVEDIDVTVTVQPKTITITGATLVSRDYAEGNVVVSVSAVTFDGAGFTIDTDYTATAQMSDDTAGEKSATVTVVLQNNNYTLSTGTYDNATVTINKVDYTGNKTVNATLIGLMDKTAVVTLPALPDGASYGLVTSDNDEFFTIGEITDGKVTLTSAKDFEEEEMTTKTFTVAVSGATNYNDYIVTVTITPTYKEEQEISSDATNATITATYGDTGLSITATTTGDGTISYAVTSGDAVTVNAQTGEITIVKAGTATITVTAAETEDYAEATFDVTVNIGKKAATVTAADKFKTYGDEDLDLTATVEGAVGTDTINYTLSRTADEDVGEYVITVTLGENPNYEVTATNAKLTINKKAASVTAIDKSKTYGDENPDLTATVEGTIGTDTINYTLSRAEGENVGEYTIMVTLGENPNYEVTATNAKLTIGKKAATVTANDKSKTYGDADLALTATIEGTVGTDTINYTLSRAEGENVGEYTITVTLGENPNYDVTIIGTATYTINQKAVTVTLDDKTVTYGEDVTLTYAITGLVGEETLTGITLTREEGTNVGTYVITATHDDTLDLNYAVTITGTATYTINQKAVTVTPEDKTITYSDDDVALTYVATGLIGDEALTGITLTREEGTNAGTYVITATHDDTLDLNYAVTITGTATYTINQKAVTVTPEDKTITYGDDELTLTYVATGLVGEETLTGVTLTREDSNNAGTYTITATHDDTLDLNYAVTITGTAVYTIQKKANTINTDSIVKEYTYSGNNFTVDGATAHGDGVISYENNVVKEAGSYTVIVKVAEGTNYLAAETTFDVYVKETAPVMNDESGINTHGKIISVENAQEGTSMTEIFKNAQEDESESKEISATIDTAIIVFDEAAIQEISTADDVELKFSVVYVDESEPVKSDALKDAEVIIKVSLSEGVTFESGKATITIDLKKEVPKKKIAKVYYVDADGNRTDMNATFADGKVTFETNHFSDYIVVFEKKGLSGGAIAGIVLACVVVLIGAVLLVLWLFKKKGNGKNGGNDEIVDDNVEADNSDETTVTTSAESNDIPSNDMSSVETVATDDEAEDGGVVVDAKGNYFNIRYNKSFTAKLIQSSDETKAYYGELKNEVLSYGKTKSRVSWAYDSVNAGRSPVVKFGIRGKTLCVYFALNAEDYADSKYKVENVESAKYEAVPCMYRIKNDRRLGYAKDLIAAVCAKLGLTKGDVPTEDYNLPYETTEALVAKGLIKELTVAATSTQIERAKAEGTIRIVDHVSAVEVNDLISNEVAASVIVTERRTASTGKRGTINVDVLSANYESGETVTIESLKEKKLIPASVGQVKLLARGTLNKVLHVELQDYSLEAVKMILATGGTVKKV